MLNLNVKIKQYLFIYSKEYIFRKKRLLGVLFCKGNNFKNIFYGLFNLTYVKKVIYRNNE